MSPSPSPPEFFVDKSLGRHDLPSALRSAGWTLRTHAEVFGARDEEVADVEWLELCGREGWIALTKDRRIRYRPAEIAAVRRYGVKAFVIASGNLTAAEQVARLLANGARIAAASEQSGPFVYVVHTSQIVRIFPAHA